MEETKTCPVCGKELSKDASICPICFTVLDEVEHERIRPEKETMDQPKQETKQEAKQESLSEDSNEIVTSPQKAAKTNKRFFFVAGILLVMVLVVGTILFKNEKNNTHEEGLSLTTLVTITTTPTKKVESGMYLDLAAELIVNFCQSIKNENWIKTDLDSETGILMVSMPKYSNSIAISYKLPDSDRKEKGEYIYIGGASTDVDNSFVYAMTGTAFCLTGILAAERGISFDQAQADAGELMATLTAEINAAGMGIVEKSIPLTYLGCDVVFEFLNSGTAYYPTFKLYLNTVRRDSVNSPTVSVTLNDYTPIPTAKPTAAPIASPTPIVNGKEKDADLIIRCMKAADEVQRKYGFLENSQFVISYSSSDGGIRLRCTVNQGGEGFGSTHEGAEKEWLSKVGSISLLEKYGDAKYGGWYQYWPIVGEVDSAGNIRWSYNPWGGGNCFDELLSYYPALKEMFDSINGVSLKPQQVATPTVMPSYTPIPTSVPTNTPIPTLSPTFVPTNTPTPSVEPMPTPISVYSLTPSPTPISGIDHIIEHEWDEGTIIIEATCEYAGLVEYKCSCGAKKTEEIPALGGNHVWDNGEILVAPTYNSTGTMIYHCTRCIYDYCETIPMLEHEHIWVEEYTYGPFCDMEGYISSICSLCGEGERIVLQPLGHKWIEVSDYWSYSFETKAGKYGLWRSRIYTKCLNCGSTEFTEEFVPSDKYVEYRLDMDMIRSLEEYGGVWIDYSIKAGDGPLWYE